MPYSSEAVSAELFITYGGVHVYHTYKNDDVEQGARTYIYTLDEYGSECDEPSFDVRDLSTWTEPNNPVFIDTLTMTDEEVAALHREWEAWWISGKEEQHMKNVIIAAIDKGELKAYE